MYEREVYDFFAEVSSHRQWAIAVGVTEDGARVIERPQPVQVSEVAAYLDELGISGDARIERLEQARILDRVWRNKWHERRSYES